MSLFLGITHLNYLGVKEAYEVCNLLLNGLGEKHDTLHLCKQSRGRWGEARMTWQTWPDVNSGAAGGGVHRGSLYRSCNFF